MSAPLVDFAARLPDGEGDVVRAIAALGARIAIDDPDARWPSWLARAGVDNPSDEQDAGQASWGTAPLETLPTFPSSQGERPEALYPYRDHAGVVVFGVARFPEKRFRQARLVEGRWEWGLGDVGRHLYRLPQLIEHVASGSRAPIFVVEGEKDVEAVEAAGGVATCSPMGAGKWRAEYADAFQGARRVIVVADRDEPGLRHARQVAESLRSVGVTAELVEAAAGKDAADHLAAGHTLDDFVPLPESFEASGATSSPLLVVTLDAFVAVEESGADALLGDADDALIPENGDVLAYGDGGAGKTTLTLDLACHLAAGDEWLGISVARPCRVLLVENEGPRPMFRAKLKRKREQWTGSPIGDRILVADSPWAQLTLADEHYRAELAAIIAEYAIDVIVLGPVTRAGMNEAGTLQEVRDFMLLIADVRARATRRVAFILVHHENKGGKVSGAWEGSGDTLLHVQGQGTGRTRLYVQKARWSTKYHGTVLQLVWTPGEGFALNDTPERDDDTIADEILDAALANPGATWTTISKGIPGKAQRVRAIRDHLIEGGHLVNTGTEPRPKLWNANDPALNTSRPYRDDSGTATSSHPGEKAHEPKPSPVPPIEGRGRDGSLLPRRDPASASRHTVPGSTSQTDPAE